MRRPRARRHCKQETAAMKALHGGGMTGAAAAAAAPAEAEEPKPERERRARQVVPKLSENTSDAAGGGGGGGGGGRAASLLPRASGAGAGCDRKFCPACGEVIAARSMRCR